MAKEKRIWECRRCGAISLKSKCIRRMEVHSSSRELHYYCPHCKEKLGYKPMNGPIRVIKWWFMQARGWPRMGSLPDFEFTTAHVIFYELEIKVEKMEMSWNLCLGVAKILEGEKEYKEVMIIHHSRNNCFWVYTEEEFAPLSLTPELHAKLNKYVGERV